MSHLVSWEAVFVELSFVGAEALKALFDLTRIQDKFHVFALCQNILSILVFASCKRRVRSHDAHSTIEEAWNTIVLLDGLNDFASVGDRQILLTCVVTHE